jgi:hypothetical protein
MKTSKKKAPVIVPPSKKNPNFMKENSHADTKQNPMAPMMKKRLSK